jgi:Histidine kinase/Y_Y_Y domain/SMP-30/Gluconolactonase/LRE-like region
LYNSNIKQLVRWNEKTAKATAIRTEDGAAITSEVTGWYQHNETAWLSVDEAFYKYDIITNKAKQIQLPPLIFPANELTVRNVVTDKGSKMWIRLRTQGIVEYDQITDKASFIKFIPPKIELSYSAMYYHRRQHSLWIAVENGGLYQYNIASKQTKHFPLYQQPGVNAATITAITGFENGDMYMSDASNGIFYYNDRTASFTQLTQQDGLPVNNCNSLTIDKKGNIWIATLQGLSKYDTSIKSFLNFTKDEILPGNLSFISTTDGENIHSCYDKDLFNWNIAAVPSKVPDAPLYIRHITINQQPVAIANSFKLRYNENNINLRIGVISPTLYGAVDFEYSLNSEEEWIKMENTHSINFSNLPPGNYTIQVRQKGNSNTLTIAIEIKPPVWKTSWFIAMASALLLAIVALFIRRRIQNIRKQASLKQQVAETEMMALRAQMNPHFIFNCISSIDNFIQDNDKENASAWLNKFAKLIRSILDSSKNEIVPFWKDWETLQLYLELEQLRSDNKFKVSMQADEALLNGHYRIPPLLVQPYVENAIHHGLLQRGDKKGNLKITATLKDNQLTYIIEDNGIGRKKSAELNVVNKLNHNSYGMEMSSERIRLFNGHTNKAIFITDLTTGDGNAAGTRVEIVLNV